MNDAVTEALANQKPNIAQIAKKHQVDRKALRERIVGRVPIDAQSERPPNLNDEEENQLTEFLIQMATLGFGFNLEDLKLLMRKLFNKTLPLLLQLVP